MTATIDDEAEDGTDGLYSTDALAQVLSVPAARVCTWIAAGLIRPTYRNGTDCYFNFREISRAKTLSELADTGLTVPSIQRSIEQLRSSLPDDQDPLQRLVELNARGRLLLRIGDGELAEVGGQLNFDFYESAEPIPLHSGAVPREQSDWHERGVRC